MLWFVRYPKHVWSPSGGWYAQPANWKANTAIMGLVTVGLVCITWTISARLEERPRMPEPGKFYPSRQYEHPLLGLTEHANYEIVGRNK